MKPDFEQYLIEKFSEDYVGCKNNLMHAFYMWLVKLPVENVIAYANRYAEEYRRIK